MRTKQIKNRTTKAQHIQPPLYSSSIMLTNKVMHSSHSDVAIFEIPRQKIMIKLLQNKAREQKLKLSTHLGCQVTSHINKNRLKEQVVPKILDDDSYLSSDIEESQFISEYHANLNR